MQIVTSIEFADQLNDLFEAVAEDETGSLLIMRNRRPVAMLLNAQLAEKAILGAYAHGVLSRNAAMQQLGLDWYGDLLQRMNSLGIDRPTASAEAMEAMRRVADDVFIQAASDLA